MTALNWILGEKSVSIAADTFSLTMEKEPFKYTNKIFTLPHLKMIVCGTGNANLILDYYKELQLIVVAREMYYVTAVTQDILLNIRKEYPKEVTTTVYLFGYNDNLECFEGFAFRSTNDFDKEKLAYGIGVKPELSRELVESYYEDTEDDDSFFTLVINKQKELDEMLPKEKRIGVGGEIQRIVSDASNFLISTIYRFDDYLDQYDLMLENLR
ncbi:hypothetical protein BK125_31030 [Paenibacillus odorifer]|uniref:Uncharacterized protein n=1 Tax=Paenibacillus odorifer TaxID=189426 RepID=A0ABX3GFP5_9BACL|nr:hypothetical protein [Paenibacillus odorifer]OMC63268.1 hypothetical protein BK125_31030 [Paenibacillus odorifer]OMD14804.1 hypothetical protein BSO21_27650 [Paenibacillus odorifer]